MEEKLEELQIKLKLEQQRNRMMHTQLTQYYEEIVLLSRQKEECEKQIFKLEDKLNKNKSSS